MQQATRLAPLGVFLAAFLLFAPSFGALFAVLDFNHLDAIRSTGAGTFFVHIFDPSNGGRTIIKTGDLYRPIYYSVFWLEYQVFGTSPMPYYVFNAALHGINAVLVFALAKRLTKSDFASVAGALIWAFHPQYADAVAWVSSTTDLLLVLFALMSVLLYAEALERSGVKRTSLAALSFCAGLLALGAKESGIAVVPIILAYHFFIAEPSLIRQRRMPWTALPFVVLPFIYFPLRLALVGNLAANGGNEIFSWNVFANIHIMAGLVAAPLVGETVSTSVLTVAQGAAGIGIIAVVVAAALFGGRREWFLGFWFLVAVAPVLIFPQVWLVGRYLYLPMVGLAVLGGIGLDQFIRLIPQAPIEIMRFGVAAALVAGLMVWFGWLNVDHQEWLTAKGDETGVFLSELKQTYPEPPKDGRLIVTDAPRSLSLTPGDGMMLGSAVRIAYDEDVDVITPWNLTRGGQPPTDKDVWYPPGSSVVGASP